MATVMATAMVRGREKMNRTAEIFDIHTHVLPGIDDGSQSWEMSIQMMRMAWDSGVRKIMATPHFVPWERQTLPVEIRRMCQEASQRFRVETGLDMSVLPGEELYYYSDLAADLEAGRAMTMNDTEYILVEFGVMVLFADLIKAVRNLHRNGYRVILAHYERYEALKKEGRLDQLLEEEVLLQSNLSAVKGGLLDQGARRIRRDYKRGIISFAASDMHNTSDRPPIDRQGIRRLTDILGEAETEKILYGNAAMIFE